MRNMLRYIISSFLLLQLCQAEFLGLTSSEKKTASKAWTIFKKYPKAGEEILLEAIKMHPDARKQFKTFASVPLENLKDDTTFQAQGNKTLGAVNRVMADLNNEQKIAGFLKEIGQMHRRRKVPPEDFKKFHLAVVTVMKYQMGTNLTLAAETAMSKLMKNVIQRIVKEYEYSALA